jgi:hypothetical protein
MIAPGMPQGVSPRKAQPPSASGGRFADNTGFATGCVVTSEEPHARSILQASGLFTSLRAAAALRPGTGAWTTHTARPQDRSCHRVWRTRTGLADVQGRAGRRGIATLLDNEVAGAHAQCDRLQFGQLSETMKSQELTPNVTPYQSVISACANGVQNVAAPQLF